MTWPIHRSRGCEELVPGRERARGELVRVVDVDGHQAGDMWAIDAADPGRWLVPAVLVRRRV